MWKHLHKHKIILYFQHGFQSGLSCESQLIETVHDWMTAMDNKTKIYTILLDFAKALDKVPQLCLLSKLTSYGITGNTQNWIKSFLSNRKQRVSDNGALSDITDVISGVPQGSVLGPVLYLLYINDMDGNIKSYIRLFADDSIIYRKICSKTDHEILQTDLNQLQLWSSNIYTSRSKLRLFNTLVKPVLLYGNETWKINKGDNRKLDKKNFKCLRRILQI